MPYIKVKLIDGVFNHVQKQQMVNRLVEAIESIDGKNPRSATWVVIEEVKWDNLNISAEKFPAVDVGARGQARTAVPV